jgi:hypothetical protein
MTYNHLQEAETIIKLLRLESKKEHADKVEEVMAGASTGTERIMGVRFYVRDVKQTEVSDLTFKKIRNYIEWVDAWMSKIDHQGFTKALVAGSGDTV